MSAARIDRPSDAGHRVLTPDSQGAKGPVSAPAAGLAAHDRFRRTLGLQRDELWRDEPKRDAPVVHSAVDDPALSADAALPWNDFQALDVRVDDTADDAPADDSSHSLDEPIVPQAVPDTLDSPPPMSQQNLRLRFAPTPEPVKQRDGEGAPAKEGHRAVGAVKAANGAPAWLTETAQQVEGLFARADPAFQTWSVTVRLDQEVLPDTDLALSLSPYAMTLRFRTSAESSAELISRHRDQLHSLLEQLPSMPPNIDIDLE